MKRLVQYIKESLFDTEKNVKDDHEVEKVLFNDYNSPFWKYLIPLLGKGIPLYSTAWENMEKEIDIDKETIWMPDTLVQLDSTQPNPFTNKYDLVCKEFYIGNNMSSGPHPDPIANGGGFKEIRTGRVLIDGMCKKMSGFKFVLDKDYNSQTGVNIRWADSLDYLDAEFRWIDNFSSIISLNDVRDFPDFKNVKSNTKRISMYDCSFFDCDEIKKKLDKFFGTGKIEANGIVKSKSIRNIVAVINNIRKYGSLDPDQIIPEGKLSDLIDLRGFKDIEAISMRNNNVKMTFIRPNNKDAIERHARFIRINNLKKYKYWELDDLVDLVKKCSTKDGWVVLFTPEQYG